MSRYGNQAAGEPLPIREVRAPNKLMRAQFNGDQRYLNQGFSLKNSAMAPTPVGFQNGGAVPGTTSGVSGQFPHPPNLPPGSRSPYHEGQMRHNPSLWPDEAQGAFLFTDHRAFQAMDVLTITINDNTKGSKKAETETSNEFDLLAGITEFFGIETSKWAANNTSLDPTQLINASTKVEFEGTGETEREGRLSGQISAVIMEVFPNGLLRVEGTKIVSINAEEEVMVISGLIRPRDISASNQVDSNRIANMRIDLYGRGIVGDEQTPGWGAKIFKFIWPF
jgi:flagellar L-ring protein precursor FlgH